MELIHALKEWAVTVDALEQGETILLLRKGGIREQGGSFTVAQSQVLLYPTYEHQQPQLLKSAYTTQVKPVPSGWHPSTVRIGSWARITHIFQVSEAPVVNDLLPYHVWNAQFTEDRLRWKPRQPLSVLLLRTYKLTQAQVVSYRPEYGGCKSWIDLSEAIALADSAPVIHDAAYAQQVSDIQAIIETHQCAAEAPVRVR